MLKKAILSFLESTVPPRTVEDVMIPELIKSGLEIGTDLFVSHSPERVIPGRVFEELISNDRIIGGINRRIRKNDIRIIPFIRQRANARNRRNNSRTRQSNGKHIPRRQHCTRERTCENLRKQLASMFGKQFDSQTSTRVSTSTQPGPGVGGHCIAVDPWFLVELNPELAQIIHLARQTNDGMPAYTAQMTTDILKAKGIEEPKVAVLGLAFKGNIDDMRESPSVDVVHELTAINWMLVAFDPHIKTNNLKNKPRTGRSIERRICTLNLNKSR